MTPAMKRLSFLFLIFSFSSSLFSQTEADIYIEEWKKFYPTKALNQGIHPSVYDYEDLSKQNIRHWIKVNQHLLKVASDENHEYTKNYPINARLLKNQAAQEIDIWTRRQPHIHSLSLYTRLITHAIESVVGADFLIKYEKNQIVCQRLQSVQKICLEARHNLKTVPKDEIENSLDQLQHAVEYFEDELLHKAINWKFPPTCEDFSAECRNTALSIQNLINHINQKIVPNAILSSPILGREEYAIRLNFYTDGYVTPEQVVEMANFEIDETTYLIEELSTEYVNKTYPNHSIPKEDHVKKAFEDMEKDAPESGLEYLEFWKELEKSAREFISEKEIATLPEIPTLRIKSAPESAGPAARIGWVASAPPFAPNPVTTLYLPSIPPNMPEQERIDFWSSFNKPFNRMIVIHELLPGHYMQIKVSRETAHPVRLLFPYKPYFEGWATFTERVCLDKGWEAEESSYQACTLEKAPRKCQSSLYIGHGSLQWLDAGRSNEIFY